MSSAFTVHSLRVQRTLQDAFDRLLEVSQHRGRIGGKDSERLEATLHALIDELTPDEATFVLTEPAKHEQSR